MTFPRVLAFALLLAAFAASSASADVRVLARDEALDRARVLSSRHEPAKAGERVLAARKAPFRFNLVGLHWRGSGDVSFRTGSGTGAWSAWRAARPEAEDGPDAGGAEAAGGDGWNIGNPYWTDDAERIQYRLSGNVTSVRAHFVSSPLRSSDAQAPSGVSATSSTQPLVASRPGIISRSQWGANESIVRRPPRYADRLAFAVVHHTAGAQPSSRAESAAIVRGIQAYHVLSNGWDDIGYNFLVDRFGQVFEGKGGGIAQNVIGAHAKGFNTGSVGVSLIGTYGTTRMSTSARAALVSLLAWRLDVAHVYPLGRVSWISGGSPRFAEGTRVTLNAIGGHRDTGLTTCPGSAVYSELDDIRRKVTARGLPKLYDPRVSGILGGRVRFTGRLSTSLAWTVNVVDGAGTTVATGRGTGTAIDWTWDSSRIPPGRYSYSMEAGPNVRPARALVGVLPPLELTALEASPPVVSPNADGVNEATKISVSVTRLASVRVWLEDASGVEVATIAPTRSVTAGATSAVWTGMGADGRAVPDGSYRLVARATTPLEEATRATTLVVDRTLGFLAVGDAFSPNGDGRRDQLRVAFELTRTADVRVRVRTGGRTVATAFRGHLDAGRQVLSWDGLDANGAAASDGRYWAVVEATTALGRRGLTEAFVVDTVPPRISSLTAKRQDGGTLVRFWLSERAAVNLSFDETRARVWRNAGWRTVWRAIPASTVGAFAGDPAGNTGKLVQVSVSR